MREIEITKDLKHKLLSLSMSFVRSDAYDKALHVYEGDYYYLVAFEGENTLVSKESEEYMIVTCVTADHSLYKLHESEMVEVIPGYYIYRQYQSDSDFAFKKFNYWLSRHKSYLRNLSINNLLY